MRVSEHCNRQPREVVKSHLNMTLCKLLLGEAALAGGLDYTDGEIVSKDPFNPKYCVIMYNIEGGKEK